MRTLLILSTAFLALATHSSNAQTPGAIQQVDSVQQRRELEAAAKSSAESNPVPELFAGESCDIGPQSVLKLTPRKTYVEASADVQYFYTDNLTLANHSADQQSAEVLVSTVQVALAPMGYPLGEGTFWPRLGYRHQWFNFGLANDKSVTVYDFNTQLFRPAKLSEFNFNVQTLFADGYWRHGNWILGAGFDFQRLLDSSSYGQFYRESIARWEVRRVFPIGEVSSLAVGYEGDYRFTYSDAPPAGAGRDFNDRTDQSFVINYAYALCRHAVLQPYYRFQYTRFTQGEDRNDYLNTFGLALHCTITRQVSLRAFVGYDILRTNSQLAQDYNKLDTGGGVNLTVRF